MIEKNPNEKEPKQTNLDYRSEEDVRKDMLRKKGKEPLDPREQAAFDELRHEEWEEDQPWRTKH